MSGNEPADVTLPQGRGPILVRGPVTIRLPDGRVVSSERPTVALCTCRLSERYPFCDTSHRRRIRSPAGAAEDDRYDRDDRDDRDG